MNVPAVVCSLLMSLLLATVACSPAAQAEKTAKDAPLDISPIHHGSSYENWLPTPMFVDGGGMWSVTWKWIKGGERERPISEIPVVSLKKDAFSGPPAEGLAVRWLGHATVLVELEGRRILFDPVFNTHASPVRAEDLPAIDAVVISHDHYDHLEKDAVIALSKRHAAFLVPAGVGRYLRDWGVPDERIKELSWWEEFTLEGLTFICAPARHFSGRGFFDRNETLWAGWIVRGATKRVYHSGDTGYGDHFAAIGARYGPFDVTMIKIGAYGDDWPYIHLTPEQAVKAHIDAKGKVFLPVHWATFPLALHPWDEPIIRAKKAAADHKAAIITPPIGEWVDMDKPDAGRNWWESVK